MKDSLLWISEENIKIINCSRQSVVKKNCNKFPVVSFNLDNMQVCETLKKIEI